MNARPTPRRIVDTHTHLPGHMFGCHPKSGTELRREFEKDGLTGAWLMTTDGLFGEPERNNDLLAEAVRNHRDFFVPFCSVSPSLGEDACLRELERAQRDLGMRGLKLHPWLQAFSLTHPAVVPILKRAGEFGFPVLFHDGTPPYSTPCQIGWAAEQAPETAIILGHSGLDDLYEDAVLTATRHPNIYLCLCSLSAGPIAEIVKRCPAEKLLFGSDAGLCPNLIGPAIAKIPKDIPLATSRKIFSENAARLAPPDKA